VFQRLKPKCRVTRGIRVRPRGERTGRANPTYGLPAATHVDERLVAADAEDFGEVHGCYAATRIGALPVSPQKPDTPGGKLLLVGAPRIVGLPFQLPGAVAPPP
jgi:hypothetical protein